jgi:hypothetical protein
VSARCLCLLVGLSSIAGATVAAQQSPQPGRANVASLLGPGQHRRVAAEPERVEIEARFAELARRRDAGSARSAIEHGRRALAAAGDALGAGHSQAAERQKQIAWAALALASRRIAAASAAHERAAAERRAVAAEAAFGRARKALELTTARLASLRAEAR